MPHSPPRALPALLACLLLATACSDSPDEPPSQTTRSTAPPRAELEASIVEVAIDVPETQRARVEAAAGAVSTEMGIPVVMSVGAGSPETVRVTASENPSEPSTAVVTAYWAAFAGFWSQRESLDLQRPGPLYLPEEYRATLELTLGHIAVGSTWTPTNDIEALLAADPDAVTLLPVELASPRLRSLTVGGIDPVRGIGDASASPLVEQAWLAWDGPAHDEFGHKLARRLNEAPPVVTSLLFTGDIIPSRCVYARHRALDDYTAAFADTADVLRAADITVGSLDAAISNVATPFGCEETFNLLAPARSVEGLSFAGFDVMTVATNHAKDCGETGIGCDDRSFLDTLSLLNDAGIAPVGGGASLAEAHQPAIIERNGVRFAFLGYDDIASSFFGATETSPGTAALDEAALSEDIARARREADVVIVLPQWGAEYTPDPSYRQMDLGRQAIEAGASLVIGNHPHVVQGVEAVGDGFIAYALGNFVFDQDWSVETQQGAVLEASFIGERLAGVRLLPTRIIDMHRPTWASPAEAEAILGRMRGSSEALP